MKSLLKRVSMVAGVPVLLVLVTGYVRYYDVIHVTPVSFADTRSVVLPHLQVFLPEGVEPRPAVLLFHGCGGVRPSLPRRAGEFVQQGYVAVIVDSFKGRNTDWERVCDGLEMFGDQRAADVLVGLEYARNHPRIDADRLFIVGYSHGGWAVLESLAYNGALPRGLSDSPAEPLAGVRGAVTWYPYCGAGTRFSTGWESAIPVLMLLAAEDQITPPEPCVAVARRQAESGQPMEWHVFEKVSHGFDTGAEWVVLADEEAHRAALSRQLAFLSRHSL
jgi:dienelactone hydrolase